MISLACVAGLVLLISEVIDSEPSTNRFHNVPSGFGPAKPDRAPAAVAAVPFSALKNLGARIKKNEQGEVVEVNFTGTNITDAGLVHIKGLTGLQTLKLGLTQITDVGLVHLKGLANLETLKLTLCRKITGAGLVHIKELTNLKELDLYETNITDAGLVHLKGMTNLQTLNLFDTRITDAGLEHLKGMTNLQTLTLSGGTQITDAGLVHLKGLANLELLWLPTKLTDAGVAELQKALPNCVISRYP